MTRLGLIRFPRWRLKWPAPEVKQPVYPLGHARDAAHDGGIVDAYGTVPDLEPARHAA
jgi:hypothetical protein